MLFQTLCVVIFAVVVGLALCFNGYRWFFILLPIWGFFAGFALGAQTMTAIFGTSFMADVIGWGVGFFVGIVFAILSYLFWTVGVAIMGASLGWSLTMGLFYTLGLGQGFVASCLALIVAILFGLFFLRGGVQKTIVIGLTALLGAAALTISAMLVFGVVSVEQLGGQGPINQVLQQNWWWIVIWLVLAALGFAAQWGINRSYTLRAPSGQRAF
jgi:hypothetical protein